MYFSTILTTALIAAVISSMATPAMKRNPSPESDFLCPSSPYSNPQCCDAIVVNTFGVDCNSPAEEPYSPGQFRAICESTGQQPACCEPPLAGQDLRCQNPPGI